MSAGASSVRDAARSVLSHWRLKALLQKALSSVPGGREVNYVLQRRITHGIPIPDGRLVEAIDGARRHVDAFRRHADPPADLADVTFFEFGAGWDLHIPLTLFALGVGSQVVVDLTPHARADLVADVVARLSTADDLDERARARLREAAAVAGSGEVKAAAACFGISYRAPADARATGLPAGSVDCVTSTSTFEHVSEDDIGPVLEECRRILRPGGVSSFLIDYSDHYSQFDASITAFNFLRFPERQWRRYNSSLQFQNRLRHSQYMAMIRAAGLEVLEEWPTVTEAGLSALRSVSLAPPFCDFDPVDLATTASHIVLRKAG